VRLDRIAFDGLDEVIVEAWLAGAPKRLTEAYEPGSPTGRATSS